ncbi:MAG TPA: ABC transporter permease subunit [Candidatus Thermoplasmatota archaeon]|nr:ABC transporter permease subunit [Candidatus Thermoplasmatota archaeon]
MAAAPKKAARAPAKASARPARPALAKPTPAPVPATPATPPAYTSRLLPAPAPPPALPAAAARPTGAPRALGPQATPLQAFTNAVLQVARKEFMQHIRTKRLLIIGGVLMAFLVMVTLVFGPNVAKNFPTGGVISREHVILTFYFGVGFIGGLQFTQLLSIVLTSDAVCSEWSNRTIFLLLSKPVTRIAFVTGKFLGNLFTITATLVTLFVVTYVLMQPFYEGSPSGEEVRGFFGMLGMIILGSAAFCAISLFFSTLTRSTVLSLLLILSLWLLVFPILGATGTFIELSKNPPNFQSGTIDAWRYFNPASDMQAGARLLIPSSLSSEVSDVQEILEFINPVGVAAKDVGTAALALLAYTVVFFALSCLVVQRRNFE